MFLPGGSLFGGKKQDIDWGSSKSQANYSSFWNNILGIAKSATGNVQIIQDGVFVCNYGAAGGGSNKSESTENAETSTSDPDPQSTMKGTDKTNPGKDICIPPFEMLDFFYPVTDKGLEDYRKAYKNLCAIKLSYAFEESGTDVSSAEKDGAGITPDKNGFIRGASDFANWLYKHYGPPIAGSAQSEYGPMVLTGEEFLSKYRTGFNGIVYFEFRYGQNNSGSGHVDIWRDIGQTGTERGFTYPYQNYVKVWFWPLK